MLATRTSRALLLLKLTCAITAKIGFASAGAKRHDLDAYAGKLTGQRFAE